jgi:hypothetical protein
LEDGAVEFGEAERLLVPESELWHIHDLEQWKGHGENMRNRERPAGMTKHGVPMSLFVVVTSLDS